ncbi:MAG TPA: MurR/RpiR family transcriptional regulator [Devosiaceae bacterium]
MDTKASPPRDFNALRSVIIEKRARLPKRLGQVANFALEHPDDIAFGTAASIASSAQVQPSTLVRFAQNFGYEGFSDLQSVFRGRLMERAPSYEDRLHALAQAGKGPSQDAALLNGFFSAGRQSLDTLSATIDVDAFSRAIDLLAKAETLFLIAKRRTFPITAYMAYAFGKMGVRHQLIASPNGIDQEWIDMATPRDAAIAISFSPYASESVAQARSMAARDVPLVAITDSAFSPLAECANVWIEVAEADHARFRSLSATMALSMALTVGIAEKRLQLP